MKRSNPKAKQKSPNIKSIYTNENLPEKDSLKSGETKLKKAAHLAQIQVKFEEPFLSQENILDKSQVKIEENTSQREVLSQNNIGKPEEGVSRFPWEERWLRGDEYYQLLKHSKYCSETFGFQTYDQLPDTIYLEPKNGTIFYLEGLVFEDIHFPRVYHFKKKFKWKKMNFVTHLPKNSPQVSYLVASTTYSEHGELCYRMHFVIPYDKCNDLMLCHILQIHSRSNFQSPTLNLEFPKNLFIKHEYVEEAKPLELEIPKTMKEPERSPEKQPLKKLKMFKKKYIKKHKVLHKSLKKTKQGNSKKDPVTLSQETIKKEEEEEEKEEREPKILPNFQKVDLEYEVTEGYFNFPMLNFLCHLCLNSEKTDDDYYNPYKNPMRSFMAYNLKN